MGIQIRVPAHRQQPLLQVIEFLNRRRYGASLKRLKDGSLRASSGSCYREPPRAAVRTSHRRRPLVRWHR